MKKDKRFIGAGIAVVVFSFAAALLTNFNLEKNYRPGDYIPEENAYFVEKIEDETGYIRPRNTLLLQMTNMILKNRGP